MRVICVLVLKMFENYVILLLDNSEEATSSPPKNIESEDTELA